MYSESGREGREEGQHGELRTEQPSYHRRRQRANGSDLVLGLSSGTSMDGVDAALVSIGRPGGEGTIELLAFEAFPYPPRLRRELVACARRGSSVAVARLNVSVGEIFAEAALALLRQADVAAAEVRCIGSHGQTLVHLPRPRLAGGRPVRATLQVGETCVIAEQTGITTVGDFRPRDMAAGGQGAPLVPLLDHRLYTHARRGRVALNLGGIANVTGLPPAAHLDDVIAFDTGPGNILLDAAVRRSQPRREYDEGGNLALTGDMDAGLLEALMEHPFYRLPPPKSADSSIFLGSYARRAWEASRRLSTADLLRTLAELTARTVAAAIERHIAPLQPVDDLVVSGGGVHNLAVMRALSRSLSPASVIDAEAVASIPADAKEAVAFALLARETLDGRAGNVPSATGAVTSVPLGKIVPAGKAMA
ncbi:MAG: anhydro-N-acetylmuramic acid kinase [Acidobacteriota bacterium]